jgi:hypothetical protein
MNKLHLIVEGEGDKEAVPVLVRKILTAHEIHHVQLTGPQVSRDLPNVEKRFEDYLRYALKSQCPILWVLDCDDKKEGVRGCPVEHVKNFQKRIKAMKLPSLPPLVFAFFVYEFESLFLAEQSALKDFYQLPPTKTIDPGAAKRRDAKGEIKKLLPKDRGYKEPIDQPKIAARLNLDVCRQVSRDFCHLEDALVRLCRGV